MAFSDSSTINLYKVSVLTANSYDDEPCGCTSSPAAMKWLHLGCALARM